MEAEIAFSAINLEYPINTWLVSDRVTEKTVMHIMSLKYWYQPVSICIYRYLQMLYSKWKCGVIYEVQSTAHYSAVFHYGIGPSHIINLDGTRGEVDTWKVNKPVKNKISITADTITKYDHAKMNSTNFSHFVLFSYCGLIDDQSHIVKMVQLSKCIKMLTLLMCLALCQNLKFILRVMLNESIICFGWLLFW